MSLRRPSRPPRAVAGVVLILAGLTAPSGCGQEGSQQDTAPAPAGREPAAAQSRLTGEERQLLRTYEGLIAAHCVRVARSLVDPQAGPSPKQEARAFAAADDLVALAARKPTAPVGPGQDVRLLVSDVAENLEGSNCDPRLIGRLEEGLSSIPLE